MDKKIIILGAAGRDFHNFNVIFRDNENYEVVAFTANQIPYISNRIYPPSLSGRYYKKGIHIYDESKLVQIIKETGAEICVMAYSDVEYNEVMRKASIVNAAGADFWLLAPAATMLKSRKKVIAICAVRTGCGKSQTARYVSKFIRSMGKRVVIIRHPMPYGILDKEIVERFKTLKDLDRYNTTIEEREDYEPHIRNNFVVFAGVDYEKILRKAEEEADVIIWDGGNNDAPFVKPDLLITVADPLRVGDELTYYPGETVARMADILLINKVNSASKNEIRKERENLRMINKKAKIIMANSVVSVENPEVIQGKSVLLVEDGPTITHGGMKFGAASVIAKKYKAGKVIDARQYAVGEIKAALDKYRHIKKELPAVGYSKKEIDDLKTTLNNARCDIVVSATPTDLRQIIKTNKRIIQVSYELDPIGNVLENEIKSCVMKE